jgi:L-ascorbate metabolism protein UlaG (beta-lactamase superfamily)
MKRRQFIRMAGTSLATAVGVGWVTRLPAQAQSATSIRYFGHTCFLVSAGQQRVLINPFRSLGCTAGLPAPKVNATLVLISSQLLDEGAVEVVPGNPRLLFEPGIFEVGGIRFQGIRTNHDRLGGRQFGKNVAWMWDTAGMRFLHLGGTAEPISLEQKILMGRPDVLMIPVGGGPKAYNPEEAEAAIKVLNPRIVIPTQYLTTAAKADQCPLVGVDAFLKRMEGVPVRRPGNSTALSKADLPKEGMIIQILSYK